MKQTRELPLRGARSGSGASATTPLEGGEGQRRAAMGAGRLPGRIAAKEYYSIGEVCDITGLKPHVLRYWESQFRLLNPSKNRAGNRAYRRKDIQLIQLVKHLLYTEKFTIEGAKQKLDDLRRGNDAGVEQPSRQERHAELLRALHDDLEDLQRRIEAFHGGR
ncbi:MAG: MerR family transcriptional regulator [Gemmatimonadota bacterium]